MAAPINFYAMVGELKRHEGFRSKPYLCSAGKLTVGIGRNLESNGISEKEAEYMAMNDLETVVEDLGIALNWWLDAPEPCREVLVNMGFNLGITRLLGFRRMLEAMRVGDWQAAAAEMLESKWARQVGSRAVELSDKIASLAATP